MLYITRVILVETVFPHIFVVYFITIVILNKTVNFRYIHFIFLLEFSLL